MLLQCYIKYLFDRISFHFILLYSHSIDSKLCFIYSFVFKSSNLHNNNQFHSEYHWWNMNYIIIIIFGLIFTSIIYINIYTNFESILLRCNLRYYLNFVIWNSKKKKKNLIKNSRKEFLYGKSFAWKIK